MKKLLLVFMTMGIVWACTGTLEPDNKDASSYRLSLTFENKSTFNFESLVVAGKKVGGLSAKSSVGPVEFDSFGFDTGMVDEDMSVFFDGQELNNHNRGFWCGTEKVQVDSGNYVIQIDVRDSLLILYCPGAPTVFD